MCDYFELLSSDIREDVASRQLDNKNSTIKDVTKVGHFRSAKNRKNAAHIATVQQVKTSRLLLLRCSN